MSNTLHKTLNLFNAENLKHEKQFYQIKHGTQPFLRIRRLGGISLCDLIPQGF
jgi:hypothetical protein